MFRLFGGVFDVDDINKKIAENEALTTAPGFWDDNAKATKIMNDIKLLKGRIEPWQDLVQRVDDLEALYELGLEERKTTFGNSVRCYNAERTVCDILRSRSRMDEETVVSAVKNYVLSKDKDFFRLYEYAQKFKVSEQVRKYMEVLV